MNTNKWLENFYDVKEERVTGLTIFLQYLTNMFITQPTKLFKLKKDNKVICIWKCKLNNKFTWLGKTRIWL